MAKKLPGISIEKRKAELASATSPTTKSKGAGTGLMIQVPHETLTWLRTKAGADGSTVRALVLQGLSKLGAPVPARELTDRRRKA